MGRMIELPIRRPPLGRAEMLRNVLRTLGFALPQSLLLAAKKPEQGLNGHPVAAIVLMLSLAACRQTPDTGAAQQSIWPTNNISEKRSPAAENTAEDLRPPGQRRRHPGSPRYPRLHRHRRQARQERHGRPARPHARHALATPGAGILPVTPAGTRATHHHA